MPGIVGKRTCGVVGVFIFIMIILSIPLIDDDRYSARSTRTEPGIDDIGEDGTEGEAETDRKEVVIIRFQFLEVE